MRDYSILTLDNPKSPVSEAYRILRTNIQFANVDRTQKLVLFTSAGMNEGKSSTIANLGITMAQTGKRVLIIDADLRKPTQHKIFRLNNSFGLSAALVSDVPWFSYISKTDQKGLAILTSGPIPPNPAELLGSNRMKEVLGDASGNYDIVLLDSPPVIAVTDATILAQAVDGVVLVLAYGEVTRDYALEAKERLEKVGSRIIGTVLNKVEMQSKEYNYYYQYYSEDKK